MINTIKILNRSNNPTIQENLGYAKLQNGEDWLIKGNMLFEKLYKKEQLDSALRNEEDCAINILCSEGYVVIFDDSDKINYTYYDYALVDDDYCLKYKIKDKNEKDLIDSEFWHEGNRSMNIKKYSNGWDCCNQDFDVNFIGRKSIPEIEDFIKKFKEKRKTPEINPVYSALKDFIIKNIKQDLSHADKITFDYQSLGEEKYVEFLKIINL
jgi:hypothetical protein